MDWLKFYYANPALDRLVDDLVATAEQGVLEDKKRITICATFLGRLIAANPDRARGWLDALSDRLTSPGARNMVQVAAYFSNTPEAYVWLVQIGGGDLAKMQAAPDLLAAPIEEGLTLDALWAVYFATGDARAIRRIVSTFNHLPDTGAAKRYDDSAKTDDDLRRANNDRLYQAAAWSLVALMKEHAPLLHVCEWMLNGPDLTPDERLSLGLALERAAPETWSVEIRPDEDRARIRKRTGDKLEEVARPPQRN